jgi:predicted GNAT family N-acyltransferase
VLRPELSPAAPLPGDDVPNAQHFAAWSDDGILISTCFVYPDPCPFRVDARAPWHLRQMATSESRRGEGGGRAVLAAVGAELRQIGCDVLWCNARTTAAGFYESAGFLRHGSEFVDERHAVPHVRMWLAL